MVAAKTTDDLLTEVRDEAQLPTTDGRIDSAGILRLASKRLSTTIADLLVSLRQERWVTTHADIPIVSGTARYRIPSRALATGVADILIVDGSDVYDAPEIDAEERWRYTSGQRGPWRSPFGYTWEGDRIVLLPTPDTSGYSLRVRYPRQPARLVEVDDCMLISSLTATTLTTLSLPSASAWASGPTIDVVKSAPGGDVLMMDTAATTSVLTLTVAAVDSEVAVGDYACLAGETCIPPIPESVWPLLVAETALAVLRAIGDPTGTADAERNVAEAGTRAKSVLAPRNRGERKMVIPHASTLRGGRFPGRSWR